MKRFEILYHIVKENRTVTWETNNIDQIRTAVFLNTIDGKAETMVFTNPGAELVYYKPATGKKEIDTWRLSRYA